MTELEELLEQKKALEMKIRMLRTEGAVWSDTGIKLDKAQARKGYASVGWYIGIRERDKYGHYKERGSHLRVITMPTREEAIALLPGLIADLQAFYELLQKGDD